MAKKHMEEEREKFEIATSVAIKARVLECCEFCGTTVYQGSEDIEDAYKLRNTMYTSGELGIFESRREMTDAIKDSVESGEHSAECCFHCHEKIYGDD
ncbi:hypothetical protein [Vibrio diazotrophicus]|nr:hypothetical protein [Vibrio diazotrophicus]